VACVGGLRLSSVKHVPLVGRLTHIAILCLLTTPVNEYRLACKPLSNSRGHPRRHKPRSGGQHRRYRRWQATTVIPSQTTR
jgi:hypothetical protein